MDVDSRVLKVIFAKFIWSVKTMKENVCSNSLDELGGWSVEQFGLNIGSKEQNLASALQTHPLM